MKIVILDAYAANPGDLSWDEFAALGELTVYDRTAQEDAAARIGDAEVVFINKVRLTDDIFAACPNLKLVSILATGYNIVDLAAAKRRGITVCNVPGYSTRAVVQMTFALLLEICQQVGLHSGAVHTGRWQTCPDFCFWDRPLIELDGKTMGIVGYGAIGSAVGAVAQALGMKLLVTARHEKPVPEGARFVSLPELLAQSDVVSLHCPQTAENARMIDAGALAQMKDGAILLNTARGGLLDEQAVADALRSGKLLADCLYRGRGEMQNKTEARRMWRTAADHGEVLAMLSLGEDCAARGEAGKALLYYRKARQTAQGMPDIEYTPRICLRLAQAETRYVSAKKAMALAAEAAQGFAILAREKEPDAAELQAEAEQLLRELADPKPRNTAYNIDSLQLD